MFSFVLLFSFSSNVLANDVDLSDIEGVLSQYDNMELIDINHMNLSTYDLIEVDSIEDLHRFLESINEMLSEEIEVELEQHGITSRSFQGVQTQSEWAPFFMNGLGAPLTVWKSMTVEYNWEIFNGWPRFTSVRGIDARIIGVFLGQGWVTTGTAHSISGNMLRATAHGFGYVGFNISGNIVGIRINDSMSFLFRL